MCSLRLQSDNHVERKTGQAKTILVFGGTPESNAVVSTITAQKLETRAEEAVHFSGSVRFDEKAESHIKGMIFPLAKLLVENLGCEMPYMDISVSNIDIASMNDIDLKVHGYSADVPLFLALVSCALDLPVRQDIAFTGHISGSNGDVGMVNQMTTKIKAAINDKFVTTLAHPVLDKDNSLQSFSPEDRDEIRKALAYARGKIDTIEIRSISDILRAGTTETDRIIIALKNRYYENTPDRSLQ